MNHSLLQRWLIAKAWLLSFVRTEWRPEHYPIEICKQVGVPADSTWFARVLNWPGPSGLGPTQEHARVKLLRTLREIAATRWTKREPMPRPGTYVPIQFASTERVNQDPELLEEFIVKALGFKPDDPVFISDESSISDFGDECEASRIRDRIREHFGLALGEHDSPSVADILVRIRAAR